MNTVSIKGLDKARVLAALYNRAKPQGMGFMHYDSKPMDPSEAAELLKRITYFDYLKGRVMKVDLSSDGEFDSWGYDRDNGSGAATEVVDQLRKTGKINPAAVQAVHRANTRAAAEETLAHLGDKTTLSSHVLHLGLDDVAGELLPKIRTGKPTTVTEAIQWGWTESSALRGGREVIYRKGDEFVTLPAVS